MAEGNIADARTGPGRRGNVHRRPEDKVVGRPASGRPALRAVDDAERKWHLVMTDGVLVGRVLAGDKQQFAALVERYQKDIYNLAYRSADDGQEAQDMAQETFLRAYRSLAQWDPERSFRAWLYAIAVNVVRDRARRVARRPRTVSFAKSDLAEATESAGPAREPPGSSIEDVIIRRERDEAIQKAVADLDLDYRLPVILFYMRGVAQQEIAEIMGVPVTVVKNRLYRARRRLRETLRSLLDEPEVDGERGWGG